MAELPSLTRDEIYARLKEKSEREDLVMFINACFAATGQTEFYSDRFTQAISIDFLHRYVLANYRTVYARALAAGINHFNQSVILLNLLRAGAPKDRERRAEEGRLIAAALRRLPANRAYALIRRLSKERVNNRRTRAVIRDYVASRPNISFDAVKYRSKLRRAATHAHLRLDSETGRFLFSLASQKSFEKPLYDSFLRAQYSKAAVYELPFTVAEPLAQRHQIKRADFLRRIEPQMTAAEKQRMQNSASRSGRKISPLDLSRTPLTKLALYVLSLPLAERQARRTELHAALVRSAQRALARSPLQLGRVAAVLDRSVTHLHPHLSSLTPTITRRFTTRC